MKYSFKGNFGLMNLTIEDSKVEGTYQKNGSLKGVFKNNTFTGSWENKGMEGLAEFTISDGMLEGNWKKGKEPGPMRSKWKGEEVSNEKNVSESASSSSDPVTSADSILFVGLKEKIKQFYDADDYAQVISTFEENEVLLETDENIVNYYLFSMWYHGDLEEETFQKLIEFERKFQTVRWLKLRGHYYNHHEMYDAALAAYKDTSEVLYEVIKGKFDILYELYEEEEYEDVVSYFESTLTYSVSLETLKIAEIYCQALYMDSDTEQKALVKTREFRERYPEHEEFTYLNGRYASYIGSKNLDLELIEEGLTCFKKIKDERNIDKTKEIIKETKNQIKEQAKAEKIAAREQVAAEKEAVREAAAEEKQRAKEAAAEEKLKQHEFKSSRGKLFCKYCGKDNAWSSDDCQGRQHGHNYLLIKNGDDLELICNKCGKGEAWADVSCS